MLSRINGARMYKVHYLDENEQIGNMDVPFYIPHDDERARFGLPSSARVFSCNKKCMTLKKKMKFVQLYIKTVKKQGYKFHSILRDLFPGWF